VRISESACAACINRAKHCPGNAVSIVRVPTNLSKDTTHRFGRNQFKLHGLPTPRQGHVLGLLGANGVGKSTALSILAGDLRPNFGQLNDDDTVDDHDEARRLQYAKEIVRYYRGSDLQNYFKELLVDGSMRIARKLQIDADVPTDGGAGGGAESMTLRELVATADERGMGDQILGDLDLLELLDRQVSALSGGELQRLLVATTAMRDAEVYMFDEISSFLDVKQRLAVADGIRSLVHEEHEGGWAGGHGRRRYVIVVEHDLVVLDRVSDSICCLYGQPGAYGVCTQRLAVSRGINQYLAGYFPGENMRFRDHALNFRLAVSTEEEYGPVAATMPPEATMTQPEREEEKGIHFEGVSVTLGSQDRGSESESKRRSTFTLHAEKGHFHEAEIIGLLGENGCGKTTLMKILAGVTFSHRTQHKRSKLPRRAAAADGLKSGAAEAAQAVAEDTAANVEPEPEPQPDSEATTEERMSLRQMGVSFKRQLNAPRFRQFPGTVAQLFERTINKALGDRRFRLLVMGPMMMEHLLNLKVYNLSGGELQRVAITICLGTPANFYLIDEPSAGLDCEQRVVVAKVIKRWIVNHLKKTVFIVEHDFVMATALAERVIVFHGQPGVDCTARSPEGLIEGVNSFLEQLEVTFRRDPESFRPRVNKKDSLKDREQKYAGNYFVVDEEEEMRATRQD